MMNRLMDDDIYRIKVILIICAGLLFICGIYYVITYRKTIKAELIETTWERAYTIQRYQTVEEDAWSVPDGGRVYDRKWKKRRTERYKSGSHTESYSCGTSDNPKTCTRTVDDYRNRDIYDWRYYYHIDKWVNYKVVKTSGDINSVQLIHWPNIDDIVSHDPVQLGDKRAGNPTEQYTLILKDYTGKRYTQNVTLSEFLKCSKGTVWRITLNILGGIVKVEQIL